MYNIYSIIYYKEISYKDTSSLVLTSWKCLHFFYFICSLLESVCNCLDYIKSYICFSGIYLEYTYDIMWYSPVDDFLTKAVYTNRLRILKITKSKTLWENTKHNFCLFSLKRGKKTYVNKLTPGVKQLRESCANESDSKVVELDIYFKR
jgi:hypothetical protein